MGVYVIEDWQGGISSTSDRGPRGSAKFLSGLDIRKPVNTLSCGQALKDVGLLGYSHSSSPSLSPSSSISPSSSGSRSVSPSATPSMSNSASSSPSSSASPSSSKSSSPSASQSPSRSTSPSPSPSAGLNSIFKGLILFFVKCSDGNVYGFDNAGYIYRGYLDGYWRNVYHDSNGAIKGAEEKPSSGGKTYLQWATDTKVMRKEIPGNSDWSDVEIVSENLQGADWHTMKQVGGANMIGNGDTLAMVGYDDSFTNEALDLIPGKAVKSLVERNGRVVTGTYRKGYPNKGVNAMLDCEVPLCQIGDDGEVFFANFTDSVPAFRFPGGGRVNPGGATNQIDSVEIFDWEPTALSWIDKQTLGNMSLWGVFDADTNRNGVYSYGRKNKEQSITLAMDYALDVDEIGAVISVDGIDLISYRDGTTFGVKATDMDNKAQGVYEGLEFRVPTKKVEEITKFPYIELFMYPLPSGASVEFWYKKNKGASWTQAKVADGSTSFSTAGGKKATFRIGDEMDIYEPKLVLNPVGNESPEIYRAKTFLN